VRAAILQGDQFLFLMVMIALGLGTPASQLLRRGALRLVGAGAFALVLSAGVAYGLVVWATQGMPSAAAAPVRTESAGLVGSGARLFNAVGCAKCHVPALPGVHGEVSVYSDLLLHDMGPSLDDKIVQGNATGADWRTTPLIGLRLRDRFLHDGRAATLRDAVLEHGGEGERVRQRFFDLDEVEQNDIYRFISSL